MQDAILSPSDASTITGTVYCDEPNDQLYDYKGVMKVHVRNSQYSYTYDLDYNQFMLRGSSLKITQWVYGIVVYTGSDTKIKKNHQSKTVMKKSKMEQQTNNLTLVLFIVQFLLSAVGAMFS